LATYIGHGHVSDRYWYISATPELLRFSHKRSQRSRNCRTVERSTCSSPRILEFGQGLSRVP
jgi:hypothetical protein